MWRKHVSTAVGVCIIFGLERWAEMMWPQMSAHAWFAFAFAMAVLWVLLNYRVSIFKRSATGTDKLDEELTARYKDAY